jgi:hypothetical protein
MDRRRVFGRLCRLRRIAFATGFVLLVLVGWVEVSHRINYGHFVSYGIHVDTLSQHADIGIPGIETMYAAETFNYTLLPIALQGCQVPTDVSPFEEVIYRYQVQLLDPNLGVWVKVVGIDPFDCESLVTTRIWPAQSIRTVDWEATGARKGFQKGDSARFLVLAKFNTADDATDQKTLLSPPITIAEQAVDPSVSYRVKHCW